MHRHADLVLWGLAVTAGIVGFAVVVSPASVEAMANEVRNLLSGVDGNAMLAKLIVPAKPTLPTEGLHKLEVRDWTNPPEMPIPTDEQPADLGLILWHQQLNEMGNMGARRYAAVLPPAASPSDLLAMSNESYRMVGAQMPRGSVPRTTVPAPAVPKAGQARTHAQTHDRRPLSPEQMKAIHASKRK